jgi:predicted  nucleic acid-binding Zn-ribbon protein
MKCVFCGRNYDAVPELPLNYCPACGTPLYHNDLETVETNMYDKVERYSNCIVEILTNTITGHTSTGWYKTEETEEIE